LRSCPILVYFARIGSVRSSCTYICALQEGPVIESSINSGIRPAASTPLTSAATRELAVRIAEIIADTPAAETVVLDIQGLSSFADYFVICSGENERQLRAISEAITMRLAESGIRPQRVEGTPASGWVVLDYGDAIVHIFDVDQRDFYRLEALWAEAPTLLVIQ
jgi:ribosome-associated protein